MSFDSEPVMDAGNNNGEECGEVVRSESDRASLVGDMVNADSWYGSRGTAWSSLVVDRVIWGWLRIGIAVGSLDGLSWIVLARESSLDSDSCTCEWVCFELR